MRAHITVESPVEPTPRVEQVRSMFDLPPGQTSRLEWDVSLPLEDRPWNLGLIVGPSGCGKSTVARHLFGDALAGSLPPWPADRSVLDAFPAELGIKDVVE